MKTTTKTGQKKSGRSSSATKEQVPTSEQKVSPESREQLKELSRQIKHLVQEGKFATVNEAIISTYYSDERNTDFRSFQQWNKDGFYIKKGEKAFLLWGKPKNHLIPKENDPGKEEIDYSFFPIAKVFSNAQVVARDKTATRENLAKLREEHIDHDQEMER